MSGFKQKLQPLNLTLPCASDKSLGKSTCTKQTEMFAARRWRWNNIAVTNAKKKKKNISWKSMKISHIKGNPSVTTKWLLFKGFMTNLQVLSLGAQRSPADLRLHLNKWFKHYSRTFNPFVTMSWDQSLTVSSHLIGWLQLSAPLEEKRAWTSELNEHVGIQWILICLYFPKSSGEKKEGEEIY